MGNKKSLIDNRFITRRQFLAGASIGLALPPLISLLPKEWIRIRKQEAPKRLCLFASEFGIHTDHLLPQSLRNSQLKPLESHSIASSALISQIYKRTRRPSYFLDHNLKSLADDTTLLFGLTKLSGPGHSFDIYSGGVGDRNTIQGRSIDYIVESSHLFRNQFESHIPTVRAINAKGRLSAFYSRIYDYDVRTYLQGSRNVVRPQTGITIRYFFDRLFPLQLDSPQNEQNQLLVDHVLNDWKLLRKGSRISNEDRRVLDEYVENIFKLDLASRRSIQDIDPTSLNLNPKDSIEFSKALMKITKWAFLMDKSRQLAYHFHPYSHHHHAEDFDDSQMYGSRVQKEFLDQVIVPLVLELKSTKDPFSDSNLLENSLIVYMNEHSGRATHTDTDIPVITFGDLGGRLQKGKVISYVNSEHSPHGLPHKMFLVSILKAMGVSNSEILAEGDSGNFGYWGRFRNNQFESRFANSKFIKDNHNNPLPIYFRG